MAIELPVHEVHEGEILKNQINNGPKIKTDSGIWIPEFWKDLSYQEYEERIIEILNKQNDSNVIFYFEEGNYQNIFNKLIMTEHN